LPGAARTALDDLELLGFVTRIRRIRRVQTPLGFKVVLITNAYRVHEPTSGLGLLASVLFAKTSESNYPTPSEAEFYSKKASEKIEKISWSRYQQTSTVSVSPVTRVLPCQTEKLR
jgi:hypothetical protein